MAKASRDAGGTPDEPTSTAAAAPVIPSRAMYLGPSFATNGVLYQHGQIFNNGVPVPWLDRIAADPQFKLLVVPIEKVGKVTAELLNPNSAYSLAAAGVVATNKNLRAAKRS